MGKVQLPKLHLSSKPAILLIANVIGLLTTFWDFPLVFYGIMLIDGILVDLWLYRRTSTTTRRWQAFSIRVFGGMLDVLGFVLLVVGLALFVFPIGYLANGVGLFLTMLGFGLLLVGGALLLRFKMKSGVIVYHGRA